MGVTAFLVPGANSPKNVHLFYNKRSGNLGVKIKSSINAQEDTNRAYGADDQDRPGIIVQSSHLDHTMISNMRIIVGVVESAVKSAGKCSACGCDKCGCPEKTHDVAIVSPYYQKITTTPADITSLAVAADDVSDTVWVYSLTGGDDKTANLTSTTVSLGTYTPLAIEPNNKPAIRDSALSAHFNTVLQKPFAYYQTNGKKNWFYQYDFETGAAEVIEVSDLEKDTAHPFTVVWAAEIQTLFLYYVDNQNRLRRYTKVIENADNETNWTTQPGLKNRIGTVEVPMTSQLTVVPSAADRRNNIFYLNQKFEFQHLIDAWP